MLDCWEILKTNLFSRLRTSPFIGTGRKLNHSSNWRKSTSPGPEYHSRLSCAQFCSEYSWDHILWSWPADAWVSDGTCQDHLVLLDQLPLENSEVFFFFFNILFTYLAAPGLSCSTRNLWFSLQNVGSSSVTREQTRAPCIGYTEP